MLEPTASAPEAAEGREERARRAPGEPATARGGIAAFASVTTLFFAWGFATALIDPLVAAVRRVFDLGFAEALLTTFAWFISYGVASLPAAALLSRLGFARTILVALTVIVAGCLLVTGATLVDTYAGVLVALFVIACGVTGLQVAANPLVAELGPRPRAHFRLNLAQAFNSLGTTVAPWLGSHVLLAGGVFVEGASVTAASRTASERSIGLAFAGLGVFFACVVAFVLAVRRRIDDAAPRPAARSASPLAAVDRGAVSGALAIFVYVGSEVTIGGTLTNFLASARVLDVPLETAGKMVPLYWGGAMIGRFAGSALLRRIRAARLLALCTASAAILCAVVIRASGATAAALALSIGLFNSIMFPTIFTLTLERSSAPTTTTSGLLVFSIIGGALVPQLAGAIVDRSGDLNLAFVVPLIGYGLLTAFSTLPAIGVDRERDRREEELERQRDA